MVDWWIYQDERFSGSYYMWLLWDRNKRITLTCYVKQTEIKPDINKCLINHDHLKQIQMGSKFVEHDPVLYFAKEITNGNVLSYNFLKFIFSNDKFYELGISGFKFHLLWRGGSAFLLFIKLGGGGSMRL
jgi:hypothetical protein